MPAKTDSRGIVHAVARPNLSEQTRAAITLAALRLIDAEGMDALSTRRLAGDLGIRGPSLYHYFESKDALLRGVRELLSAELWGGVERRLADVDPGDWEGVLRGYVEGALGAMAEHPNAVAFMALTPISNRRTLTGYESILERLTAAGWPLGFAWRVFLAAENLMLSAALEAGAPGFAPPPDEVAGLPLLRAVVAETAADPTLDEGFTVGLDAFLAGVRTALAAPELSG